MLEGTVILIAVSSAVAAIASAFAASKSLKMAERATEPVVVFDLELHEPDGYVYLVVKNIGQSPAYHINLTSSPELETNPDLQGRRVSIKWGSFAEGIGNLYPGMVRSICWADRRIVNNDLLTTRYVVTAEYFVDPSINKNIKHKRQSGTQLAFDMLPIEVGLAKVLRDGLGGCKRSIENLPRLNQDGQ
tara:strand:+ start:214 stop:780 length:567 start_codon:yes stop_codon:yes gene_type:complete